MRPRSLGDDAERHGLRELDLAAHEAARYRSPLAGFQHCVQPVARRVRNGDEDRVRGEPPDRPADVVEAAHDGDPLQPAPAKALIVIDEADHALAWRLAELAQQAAPAAAGADDERPPLLATADQGGQPACERALPEAREPDEEGAQQDVDEEDAAGEAVP